MAVAGDVELEAAATRMRIHVRGLGGSVTKEDLEKTFSSLGRVSCVELVSRPEGGKRFGYMDFEPNSEKSITRLFATYNGCIWKGGKLKLEKAKEHYLDRLRREWSEASEIVENKQVTKDDSETLEKSKSVPIEKLQLRLFFPKLKKVKALPFKGTGKHKYSFQRIEVPPLPIHFCDCEEHCGPGAGSYESFISSSNQNGGLGKKEINAMNNVMKRLFEKEKVENAADANLSQTTLSNSFVVINDRQISEMEETAETGEEDLVMNIGSRDSNSMLGMFQRKGWGETARAQDGEGQNPTHDSVSNNEKSSKRQKTGKHGQVEEPGTNKKHILSVVPSKEIISKNLPQELQESSRMPTNHGQISQKIATDMSTEGSSWLQKSPWKKLVGNASTSNFTVSQLLPCGESVKKISQKKSVSSTIKKAKKVSFKLDKDYPKSSQNKDLDESEGLFDKFNEMETSSEDDAIIDENLSEQDAVTVTDQTSGNSETNTTEELISLAVKERTSSEVHFTDPRENASAHSDQHQTNQNLTTDQSGRGSCWLQKSSWTHLVGDNHASTFSISQLVPGIDALKPKTLVPSNMAASSVGAKVTYRSNKGNLRHSEVKKISVTGKTMDYSSGKLKSTVSDSVPEKAENPKAASGEKSDGCLKIDSSSTDSGNVFSFMRSDASEMQWAKTRAALIGQLKRTKKSDAMKHSREWSMSRN